MWHAWVQPVQNSTYCAYYLPTFAVFAETNFEVAIPNWKLRPRNCLRKEDDGRTRILLSAREMIIRRRNDRFITEIVPMLRPKRVGGRQ